MHIYRQTWRANSTCERLRMLPVTGGSAFVQAVTQGLGNSATHAIVLLHAPYQALVNGRDQATVQAFDMRSPAEYYDQKLVSILNAQNAPLPGTTLQGSNTSVMFLFDMYDDKTDSPGPVSLAALNAYLLNSYDVFLNSSDVANNYGTLTLNSKSLTFRNFKSLGTNPNNGGINIVQFDYDN